MENRSWQGAYPESIRKANVLALGIINSPSGFAINKITGERFRPHGFLVLLEHPQPLRIAARSVDAATRLIARWIDALPTSVHYVHGERDHNRFTIAACVWHEELWEAEIESISRGGTAIKIVP